MLHRCGFHSCCGIRISTILTHCKQAASNFLVVHGWVCPLEELNLRRHCETQYDEGIFLWNNGTTSTRNRTAVDLKYGMVLFFPHAWVSQLLHDTRACFYRIRTTPYSILQFPEERRKKGSRQGPCSIYVVVGSRVSPKCKNGIHSDVS